MKGITLDGLVGGLLDGIGDGLGDGIGDGIIDRVGYCLGIKSGGKIGDWIGSLSVFKCRIIIRDKSGSKSGIISPYKLGGIADNLSISNDQFSIIDVS